MQAKKILYRALGLALNSAYFLAPRASARKAYDLFTTVPKPVLREKELRFLSTATERSIKRAGKEIVEYHWGDEKAPWVLLSYGWGYNAGRWRHFVPQLVEAGFRVIAYDPPGHGKSPKSRLNLVENARIIENMIRSYGRPSVLVGHSFGGASAVNALMRLPISLHPGRMVVMATFADASSVFRVFQRTLGLWECLYQQYVRHIELITESPLRSFDLARRSSELGHIDTLIVHDPRDSVTPVTHAQRFHAYWPNSALYLPLRTGHHLGTARVTEAILQFALDGRLPPTATVQERPLPAKHDLVRYFAGLEV